MLKAKQMALGGGKGRSSVVRDLCPPHSVGVGLPLPRHYRPWCTHCTRVGRVGVTRDDSSFSEAQGGEGTRLGVSWGASEAVGVWWTRRGGLGLRGPAKPHHSLFPGGASSSPCRPSNKGGGRCDCARVFLPFPRPTRRPGTICLGLVVWGGGVQRPNAQGLDGGPWPPPRWCGWPRNNVASSPSSFPSHTHTLSNAQGHSPTRHATPHPTNRTLPVCISSRRPSPFLSSDTEQQWHQRYVAWRGG